MITPMRFRLLDHRTLEVSQCRADRADLPHQPQAQIERHRCCGCARCGLPPGVRSAW
jgi:hypothetical protein